LNTKICKKCKREFPATDEYFPKQKTCKGGLRNKCKICKSEYERQYHIDNAEHLREYSKQHYIEHKDRHLEYRKQYHKEHREEINQKKKVFYEKHKEEAAQYKKQYHEKNRELNLYKSKQYREKNNEKVLKKHREWVQNNPEKTRNMGAMRRSRKMQLPATLTIQQWQIIKDYFNNKCAYCGKEKPLTQDHFVALSKGGAYTHNNIVCACATCNSSKQARDFEEWYPKQKFYSKKREKAILKFLGYNEHGEQQPALMI